MKSFLANNLKLKLAIATTIAITMAMILVTNLTAYAATTTYTDGQTSGSIHITAVVGSTYSVTLPATLELTYNSSTDKYEGTYMVGVKANLTDSEKVTVIPSDTTTLSDGKGNTADASVSQTVDTWKLTASENNEIASNYQNFVETTGTVSATITKAGSYTGDLQFTFSKSNL